MRPRLLLAACLLVLAGAAPAQSPAADCPTVDACLAQLEQPLPEARRMAVYAQLQSLGPAAVDTLVTRLSVPDRKAADAAGLALAQFKTIDPRHLPALIAAARAGNGWMPRAIAATGSEEALRYLEGRFLARPDFSGNTQVFFALPRFGNRLRPFVAAQAERCRTEGDPELCGGLLALLGEFRSSQPAWADEARATIAAAENERARHIGEDSLIYNRDPKGLPILRSRLESLLADPPEKPWQIGDALRQIGNYGAEAADLGPLVAQLLESQDADLRAQAALTLSRTGSPAGAERLIALEPGFADDWLLAYNAVEALGRNRVAAAKPLLKRTARGHWHRAVRNNAERALNSLAGGEFARAAASGVRENFFLTDLRHDDAAQLPRSCVEVAGAIDFSQDPALAVRWPRRGAERLRMLPVAVSRTDTLRPSIPLGRSSARITFRQPLRTGEVFGFDQGEFGGGLVHVRSDGSSETLANGNPRFAFRMGKRLYVAEGLSHLGLDRGSLLVLDGAEPRIVRRIRLPAAPIEVIASSDRVVILRTAAGDMAIREDGRLIDPESLGSCTEGKE